MRPQCPSTGALTCKTGLANEEVFNGKCERCGHPIERKMLRQWMLKITAYAERLLEDLDGLDWPKARWPCRKTGSAKAKARKYCSK